MCRRWSDDRLCSLLKWNMIGRELSAISFLAWEAPIWSWVLSVLCCGAACCCNITCRCLWPHRSDEGDGGGSYILSLRCSGSLRRELLQMDNKWGVDQLNWDEGAIKAVEELWDPCWRLPIWLPHPTARQKSRRRPLVIIVTTDVWQEDGRTVSMKKKNNAGDGCTPSSACPAHTHTYNAFIFHLSHQEERKEIRLIPPAFSCIPTQQHNNVFSSQWSDCNPPKAWCSQTNRKHKRGKQ